MIHHFLHKGHALNDLVNLSSIEKAYMQASMYLHLEEEEARWSENAK